MKVLLVDEGADLQGEIIGVAACIDLPEFGTIECNAAKILVALLDDRDRLLDEIASETRRANNLVQQVEAAHELIAFLEKEGVCRNEPK
jgi:hypothetical protein